MDVFRAENIRSMGRQPRPGLRWHALAAAATASILVIAAGGCGEKTVAPQEGEEAPLQYLLPPTSPRSVLQNLVSAYNRRDSTATASVYDSSYVGTSADPSSPTPTLSFTRADEIRHVSRLKLDANIVSVSADLGQPAAWQVLDAGAGDPSGWKTIQINSQTVRIEDIANATSWISQNNVMEYTFKPRAVPGAPASEDTVWTIVRWTEIAN